MDRVEHARILQKISGDDSQRLWKTVENLTPERAPSLQRLWTIAVEYLRAWCSNEDAQRGHWEILRQYHQELTDVREEIGLLREEIRDTREAMQRATDLFSHYSGD